MSGPLARYPAPVWILFSGRLITAAGFSFSFPFFTLYAANHLHISATLIGLVLMASGLVGAFSKALGGEWSDRWGRKSVMQLALAGRAVTAAGIAWVIWKGMGFVPLSALMISSNFFGQLFEPSSQAFVADITQGRTRVESFGIVRMGINAGWALGPLVHVFVTESYALAFAVTAGVFALSFCLFTLVLREPKHAFSEAFRMGDLRTVATNAPFVSICLTSIVVLTVSSQLVASTSVYTTRHVGLPEKWVPLLFSVNGGLVFLLQLPASRWMGQAGLVKSMVLGCVFYGIGYGSYAFARTMPQFAACVFVVTLGEILAVPAGTALVAQLSPDAQRGRYMGIYGFATNLGWCLGPPLGGSLLDLRPGPGGTLWFPIAGLAVLGAFAFSALSWRHGVRPGPVEAPVPEPVAAKAP